MTIGYKIRKHQGLPDKEWEAYRKRQKEYAKLLTEDTDIPPEVMMLPREDWGPRTDNGVKKPPKDLP